MKKLLKHLSLILIFCATCHVINAQGLNDGECLFVDPPNTFTNPDRLLLESKNGWILPASGTIRILIIFAEVNYDTGTDPNPNSTTGWPVHSLPTWADQLLDPNVPSGVAQGALTRYFQLASSGQLNVIGDYLLAPTNGGIFSILNSQGGGNDNSLSSVINTTMNGSFITGHSLNNVSYFDNWTMTNTGQAKISPSTDSPHKYDHVMYIWRNRQGQNGCGWASGSGYTFLGNGSDTYSDFLTYDGMPINISRHEFSHLLYGGNNFHCGGGGWGPANYWIPQESGWSNLGLYGCSLLSWNAWDRQRMGWKATGNQYNPSARNSGNTAEVNGDLDATTPSQAGIYTLRDFVTTGDAIRIKLPFTNISTEYPEYIWIENHNGISMNSCAQDRFQHQSESCVQPAIYGLYMYMQIDRETRQSTDPNEIYSGYADYLRPITAEGFYDRLFETSQVFNSCVQGGNTNAFIRNTQNPLTGGGDQDLYSVDINGDNLINQNDQYPNCTENQSDIYLSHLYNLGNTRHAFTLSGNKKLGVGTNPSSASMMNMVSYDIPLTGLKNLRKIYINGVSIEILNQYTNGNIQVQIRFDDVDVNNDARWCADEIVLSPVSTTTGYSLNLKSNKTITIDQGKTATRMDNPQTINGQKIFASPTLFRCTANSWFNMETNSNVIVDNGSTLKLEQNSKYEINSGAVLRVKNGSVLSLETGSTLKVNDGGSVIIESGGTILYNGGTINLNGNNALLEIKGTLNIATNANFTFTGAGYVKFSSTANPSNNIIANSGSSIALTGSGMTDKVLEITQETMNTTSSLSQFTVTYGQIAMAPNSRLSVPGPITFNNTKITKTTAGGHRGLWLYGQNNISLNVSVFEYGNYGIYDQMVNGGNVLNLNSCNFLNNTYGLYTINNKATLNYCAFNTNLYGWYATGMSQTSTVDNSTYTNNDLGIKYFTSGTGGLKVSTSSITGNSLTTAGIEINGTGVLTVNCSTISNNELGILLQNNATLCMSPSQSPAGQKNAIIGNIFYNICTDHDVAIPNQTGDWGNLLLISGGKNNLLYPSGAKVISGRLTGYSCGTNITATNNRWNSGNTPPVSGTDYRVYNKNCSRPTLFTITDNSPTYLACDGGGGGAMASNSYLPESSTIINTYDNQNVDLTTAVNDAIALMELNNKDGDDLKAIEHFNKILNNNNAHNSANDDILLEIAYNDIKSTLGNAFANGKIKANDDVLSDKYFSKVIDIIEKKISKFNKKEDEDSTKEMYYKKFYASMDKAEIYRLAGKRDLAISNFNDILNWASPEELPYINYWICLTTAEDNLIDGLITSDDFETTITKCATSSNLKTNNSLPEQEQPQTITQIQGEINSTVNDDYKMDIFPNPFSESTTIKTSITEEKASVEIYNLVGIKIKSYELIQGENAIEIKASDFDNGIYYVILKVDGNNKLFEKIIVSK